MVGPMPDDLLLTGSGRRLLPAPYDGPLPWAIAVRYGRFAFLGSGSDAAVGRVLGLEGAVGTPGLGGPHLPSARPG